MQNGRPTPYANGPDNTPRPLGISVPTPDGGLDVHIPSDGTAQPDDGGFIVEAPDGSAVINLDPQDSEAAPGEFLNGPHDQNLAEVLPESVLNRIGADIIAAINEDIRSRSEWENQVAEGIRYLGLKIEDRTKPFKGASGVFSPILLQACIRLQATAGGEMLPAGGPCKTEIIGAADDDALLRAQRVKQFMNLYLTEMAPEFYDDYDTMLWWWTIEGSAFKKVYFDPILARPVSPFISARDIIVPYKASSLTTAARITHRLRMSEREIKMQQLKGVYLDTVTLTDPTDTHSYDNNKIIQQAVDTAIGVAPTQAEIDKWYTVYETHLNLDIEGAEHTAPNAEGVVEETGLAMPYRVTVEENTQKVLAIYKNWDERDTSYQRKEWFVHYPFVPGMGFYGLGYAHILGNSTRGATALARQSIDAATLAMMPSGLRAKGGREPDNNITVAPLEFALIETGGQPIGNQVMPLPFKGVDPATISLLQEINKSADNLSSATEIAVGEGRQDAPVGTTIALLEAATRVEGRILKRCHTAMKRELRMIAALFGEHLPEEPYPFEVPGGQGVIMRADFQGHVDVIPVSDPNIASGAQRLVRAQAMLQMAMQAPQIHDMREAYFQMYLQMGLDEERIAKLMPPPQQAVPMDPLSENQAVMMNKPVVAAIWQQHSAHVQVHQALMQVPAMAAHIAEHLAMESRVQIETMLNIKLPPAGTQLPPDIQNQIAMLTAQAMQHLQAQAAASAPGGAADPQLSVAQQAIQVQAMDLQRKFLEQQQQAAAQVYAANQKSEAAALDRQSRIQVANIRAAAQLRIHGLPPMGQT